MEVPEGESDPFEADPRTPDRFPDPPIENHSRDPTGPDD
jgi:hypothetical protein